MKKILILLFAALLLFAMVGCAADTPNLASEATETATMPEETPPPVEETSELPIPDEEENAEVGVIIGEVFYKDIPISRLFLEPFIDVLGEPIDQRGAFFFYEGLEIMGDRGDLVGYENMAINLFAHEPHLDLFELNGIPLDMTRIELIAMFDEPHEELQDYSLVYRVSSSTIGYGLRFWFESADGDALISSITIEKW